MDMHIHLVYTHLSLSLFLPPPDFGLKRMVLFQYIYDKLQYVVGLCV